MSLISPYFGWIPCVLAICPSKAHHSFQFLLQKPQKILQYLVRVSLCISLTGKCLGKVYFFFNNHMSLLGYRISIISIRYPTIRFDLIEKVKMLIYRLSMTSLISYPCCENVILQDVCEKPAGIAQDQMASCSTF